jgi:biotin operon repressor
MEVQQTLPDKNTDHERVLSIVFNISPAQAGVLSLLARVPFVTGDQLTEWINAKSEIKTVVSKTRSKLKEHGVEIHSRIGAGYWIEAADREMIAEKVDSFMESA